MSDKYSLFPAVRGEIEFDYLLEQAKQEVMKYSGQNWTDFSEHDPGITLLEALGYGIADLAYRHTRPLNDLLTPSPEIQSDEVGIFPIEFGPQKALTCSPVTEDDYRRAILDLHSTGDNDGYFFFSNVCLIREPEAECYRYWYNPSTREFTFEEPNYNGEHTAKDITLLGNYHLYLVPTEETQSSPQAAKVVLDDFLLNNRNLGEYVSRVIWLQPEDVFLKIKIEINDKIDITNRSHIAAILADIYKTTNSCITPPVEHYSTEQLSQAGVVNEDIYEGPFLHNGWIPKLPPRIDVNEPTKINLSEVVSALLNISGVNRILYLGCGDIQDNSVSELQWVADRPGYYPRLWGKDPMEVLAAGNVVQLLSCGGLELNNRADLANNVLLSVTAEEIEAELNKPKLNKTLVPIFSYGRWRDPGKYYPATNIIPSCYNLKTPAVSSEQTHLHQFLLIFEQLLANDFQYLALLPKLLSFKHQGDEVWGQKWPFEVSCVSAEVHREYHLAIEEFIDKNRSDLQQALSITGFLLGYFNRQLAPNAFQQPAGSYLASQQGCLSRQAELGYYRANIRIDRLSSLQLRIAARLGLGGADIFNDYAKPELLPFYLVEHRALLPVAPAIQYNTLQLINTVLEKKGHSGKRYLEIYCDSDIRKLSIGQQIDMLLEQGTQNQYRIRGQIVKDINVEENYFLIDVISNSELDNNLDEILNAEPGTLAWQNCAVLFEDINYALVFSENQSGLKENQKRLNCSPFPVMLSEADSIIIYKKSDTNYGDSNVNDLQSFNVVSIDRIANTLVINNAFLLPSDDQTNLYQWHISASNTYAVQDRFSFMVSVVFNQELLSNSNDRYVTEAWCRKEIMAEVPSHINVLIHWKPDWEYRAFALSYNAWKDSGLTNSATVYELLYWLSLGKNPSPLTGIGAMYVASFNQQLEVIGPDGLHWDDQVISSESLFYIP